MKLDTLKSGKMTLEQIKKAVESGKAVHWSNELYSVVKDSSGQWLIVCANGSAIGLTWQDGTTLNGKETEFFVK